MYTVNHLKNRPAPDWQVEKWLGSDNDLSLAQLRGKVVVLHAFQMLCPGCVTHGIPQAKRIQSSFPDVAVIGMHTVFEHHDAMQPHALAAFMHEYRINFPVAVDQPGSQSMPKTMEAYQMRGTPTLILIDAQGILRYHYFGRPEDMMIGANIAQLLTESYTTSVTQTSPKNSQSTSNCDADGCRVG